MTVKTIISQTGNGWLALYRNRFGNWRTACDALDRPILCDTRELALSVAGYRRLRLATSGDLTQ